MITSAERQRQRRRWHKGLPPEPRIKPAAQADAHRAVLYALREGILRPWPRCAVWTCNQRHVHAHHASYAPDMRLAVTWLCRRCHTQLHMEQRAREMLSRGRNPAFRGQT